MSDPDVSRGVAEPEAEPVATLRRSIDEAIHFLEMAEAVLRHGEDPRLASGDVYRAKSLIVGAVDPGISRLVGALK
jgi:hypothetical protein